MSELVKKLSLGDHAVIYPGTLEELRSAIGLDYVHVKFTETRGGTELGFRLDPEASDLSSGDVEKGTGRIRMAGRLNLDGVDVLCVGELDLTTLEGKGHLEILEEAKKD